MQWPFGYGLSYTTFKYDNVKVDRKVSTSAPYVNLSFEVENTGQVAADEVAQIYLMRTDGRSTHPSHPTAGLCPCVADGWRV